MDAGLICVRFKIQVTVSDMASSYEKYGKEVSGTLSGIMAGEKVGPYHIHDIGHMVKNAECSLEIGTHFDGKYSYNASDMAVLLTYVEDSQYEKLNSVVSHKSVLQYEA